MIEILRIALLLTRRLDSSSQLTTGVDQYSLGLSPWHRSPPAAPQHPAPGPVQPHSLARAPAR